MHSDTINFIEKAQQSFQAKAEHYKIGKGASRDKKIKERYKRIAKDLKYILDNIKSGQI